MGPDASLKSRGNFRFLKLTVVGNFLFLAKVDTLRLDDTVAWQLESLMNWQPLANFVCKHNQPEGHQFMGQAIELEGTVRMLPFQLGNTQSSSTFFESLGAARCANIKIVCSDMWKPYLNVVAAMLPAALDILDRFHIAKKLCEAVAEVRRQEAAQLAKDGYEPALKDSRDCFLKRRANLTIGQATKLRDLLKYDLRNSAKIKSPLPRLLRQR